MTFAGAAARGTATLDLKTAKPDVAKGLVHKYVVMVRQNARRGTASTLTKSEVRVVGASLSSRREPVTPARVPAARPSSPVVASSSAPSPRTGASR